MFPSIFLYTHGNLRHPGAGKSTFSKAFIAAHPSFTRLSLDAINAARHGFYGIDYDRELHEGYMGEADEIFISKLESLLREGKNAVLDRAFYAKEDRDDFKARVEAAGGKCILVYLKADRDLLWKRICERRAKGINADSALEISEELLNSYVSGFEAPVDEGEIVVIVE